MILRSESRGGGGGGSSQLTADVKENTNESILLSKKEHNFNDI